jgi:hypothetical protein
MRSTGESVTRERVNCEIGTTVNPPPSIVTCRASFADLNTTERGVRALVVRERPIDRWSQNGAINRFNNLRESTKQDLFNFLRSH